MRTVSKLFGILMLVIITFTACQEDPALREFDESISKEITQLIEERTCGMHHHMDKLLQNPIYKAEYERKIKTALSWNGTSERSNCSSPVLVPVAVHFQGISNPNVSCLRQLAQSQIDVLNQDYQATNSDIGSWTANAASSFPGINNGEACIEFVIASKNHPSGYGISNGDPAVTINKTNGDFDSKWANYLNIFVQANTGVLGYSPLGGSGNGDGVVIDANAFGKGSGCGSISPNAPYNLGRTLTHELGHYLLLDHIWGNGCAQDDGVSDTPNSKEEYYGCPSLGASSCNSTDMWMNYMDYVNDACMYMFSAGQVTRMENYLSNSLSNITNNAANVLGTSGGGSGGGTGGGGTGGGGGSTPTCTDGIQNGDETGVDCGGSNCPPCQTNQSKTYKVIIKPDNYGSEIDWELINENDEVVASGGPYADFNTQRKVKSVDLETGCYTFAIYDSYGDGMCCDYGTGWYRIKDADNKTVVFNYGDYGYYDYVDFCVNTSARTAEIGKRKKDQKRSDLVKKSNQPDTASF